MTAAKAFVGAWGALSVGASECTNTTFLPKQPAYSSDVAVDSKGNVWFASASATGDAHGNAVWRCTKDGDCKNLQPRWSGVWERPVGIAVNLADERRDDGLIETVFYVSEGHATGNSSKVKRCSLTFYPDEEVSCKDFGSGWTSPHGLAVDKSYVYITDSSGDKQGVWKCSPFGYCTMVGDVDGWQRFPPVNVVVDSQGTVYVTSRVAEGPDTVSVRTCTSSGVCSDGIAPGDFHWPSFRLMAVAVDPDDNLYMSASLDLYNLIRCPHGQDPCESLGAFHGGSSMAIDQDGVLYVAGYLSPHGSGLRRVCLSQTIKDIQV